jgi:hypothetical protein
MLLLTKKKTTHTRIKDNDIKEIREHKKHPRRFSLTALKHKLESLTVASVATHHEAPPITNVDGIYTFD